MTKTKRLRKQIARNIALLVLAACLVCAGWMAFWRGSRLSAPFAARPETTLPSQFSGLSPEANELLEAKVKGQERTLSDYLPGSADARRRLDETSSKYNLSPEEQKRSDDLNRRTAEGVEIARKKAYLPEGPN
jgi:hypothetical protein